MSSMSAPVYVSQPGLYQSILAQQKPGKRWAIDLETYVRAEWRTVGSALDPHTGGISLITLHDGEQTVILDWFLLSKAPGGCDPQPLFTLLSQAEFLVAANARFEAKWLLHHLGMQLVNWRCVVVMSTLLANATGSKFGKMRGHSLQALCRDLLGIPLKGKGTLQIEDWSIRPTEDAAAQAWWQEKLAYATGDVMHLLPIHDLLYRSLTEAFGIGLEQGQVLALEMGVIPVVAQMELEGTPVSRELLDQIYRQLQPDPFEGSFLDKLGCEILQELGQPTARGLFSGAPVLDKRGATLLNNPVALKKVLQEYYGFKNLDSVQAEMLRRTAEVMEYLSQAESAEQQWESLEEICASEEEQAYYEELLAIEPEEFQRKMPLLGKLLHYKKLEKMRSMDLRKSINPATGRIHSSFNQCFAATGRMSSSSPNVQQISGRTQVLIQLDPQQPFHRFPPEGVPAWVTSRHCFVAPAGYSLVSVDYKSQEMLIAAVLSGDKLMLASFSEPPTKTTVVDGEEVTYPNPVTDLHLLTTKDCCFPNFFEGKPEHEWLSIAKKTTTPAGKALRDVAKTVNFGLIYLATPKTLAKQVYAPEQEAVGWVKRHQGLYTGFWEWAKRQERLANARGWARNQSTGRIRWVAEDNAKAQGASPGRSGVNHLVQSTGADITKLAMIYLHTLFDGTEAKLLMPVHDELVCLVPGTCEGESALNPKTGGWEWRWKPDEQVQEWITRIRREMERAECELLGGHPGFTDAKAAPFWWH